MSQVYSTAHIAKLYSAATSVDHLTIDDLAERGARAFVSAFSARYRGVSLVHVFAGPYECGAYALATARQLHEAGYQVRIYLFYISGMVHGVSSHQVKLLEELDLDIQHVLQSFTRPTFATGQVIVDGLFGAELQQPLSKGFAQLVSHINASGLDVVSLDLPSGLMADGSTPPHSTEVIRAHHTFTLERLKLGMLMPTHTDYVGQWHVLPLGISDQAHREVDTSYFEQSEALLGSYLRPRKINATRQDYGHALIIGGCPERYSYLALAARAALYGGCGAISTFAPDGSANILQSITPELEVLPMPSSFGALRGYTAIAVGTAAHHGMSVEVIQGILKHYNAPLILDDLAIDCLAQEPALLAILPTHSVLLVAQAQRPKLVGMQSSDVAYLQEACELASKYHLNIVLKGVNTAICTAAGNVYFNTSGNAGLATRASGDILTGLILGLVARGYDTLTATLIGCYLHGRSADQYAARYSMESLTPSQLLDELPRAIADLYR